MDEIEICEKLLMSFPMKNVIAHIEGLFFI